VFNIVFYQPEIPPNTGNAIRLSAVTGCLLHLVEPLGFDLSDAKLRRAGLDYHDLASVTVHPDLDSVWAATGVALGTRVFAFTGRGSAWHTSIEYRAGDVLLFGPESVGLPVEVLELPEVTEQVRIPMLPSRRSLNLANSASIAIYEAWRQQGFPGAV
jgi:tRNA (cytidine/uridine-2'-O-)-methyltransferase